MTRIPLVRPSLPTLGEIEGDLRVMLETGRLTNFGPFATRLEHDAAAAADVRYAAAVSSGTTALVLLLNTLPRGSEVVLPSFTFIATAQAVIWNDLIPVFADIEPDSLNVDPRAVEACITPRTSAILAVHAFGAPCAVGELEAIAARHDIRLFFDAAHAFGSRRDGRPVGSFGDAEVFSLSATKLVPSGEGGLVSTNDEGLYSAILDRRNYGLDRCGTRDCAHDGLNGKLAEFNAILALREVATLPARVRRRNQIAQRYRDRLAGMPGLTFQTVRPSDASTYKDFTVQVDPAVFGISRDDLRRSLAAESIETAPYFWPALHQMTRFRQYLRENTALPVTEQVADRILSLPMFEDLDDADVDRVVRGIENAAGRAAASDRLQADVTVGRR